MLYRVGVQTMIDLANALVFSPLMLGDPAVLGIVLLLVSLVGIKGGATTCRWDVSRC